MLKREGGKRHYIFRSFVVSIQLHLRFRVFGNDTDHFRESEFAGKMQWNFVVLKHSETFHHQFRSLLHARRKSVAPWHATAVTLLRSILHLVF